MKPFSESSTRRPYKATSPWNATQTSSETSSRPYPLIKLLAPMASLSQLLKAITIQQVVDLSKLFTTLANDIDYRSNTRPDNWNQTLAMLLPKEAAADKLDRHRAIALMSQVQKLYSKWLLSIMTPALDPLISENQAGFRRHRQASEILHTISKLIELHLEWQAPLTIMRLDLKKAFDRLKQSSILETLEASPLAPKVIFNAARELIGCHMHPTIYGCVPEDPVPLAQGTKQGAPESGLYFVSTLSHILTPLKEKWDHSGEGCPLDHTVLNHLIFADDLLLISPSPHRALTMYNEVKPALAAAGLEVNDAKTAFLTTHPQQADSLPGTNANQTGMKILGRTFTLSDNTPQEMDLKIGIAWARFNRLRHILRANTPLPHRLRIFTSCVGQALLWASETWHITRRRLQRLRGVELAMMRTLIRCPPLPPDTDLPTKFATHKAHIRTTLSDLKYESLDRKWVRKYYSWAGHLARLPPERLAKKALLTKNLAWWKKQQNTPSGHRHVKRRGNLSRWENPLGRHHPAHELWPQTAQFRDRWNLYYPAFEQRLFGPHCPHTFDPDAETRYPPPPGKEANRTQEPQPPPNQLPRTSRQHGPLAGKGTPPLSRKGKHPRASRDPSGHTPPSVPPAKRARTTQGSDSAATKSTTPAQVARSWEESLAQPLITLALPQDVSRRSGLGVGNRGRATSCAAETEADAGAHSQISQTHASTAGTGEGSRRRTCTRGGGTTHGHRRGADPRQRPQGTPSQQHSSTQDRCTVRRPCHRQGPTSTRGAGPTASPSTSTSTSTSTSSTTSTTSSSASSSSSSQGSLQRGRAGHLQRSAGKSKGKGQRQASRSRPRANGGPGGVLGKAKGKGKSKGQRRAAKAHMADCSWEPTAQRRQAAAGAEQQEKHRSPHEPPDDDDGQHRHDAQSSHEGRALWLPHEPPDDDDGQARHDAQSSHEGLAERLPSEADDDDGQERHDAQSSHVQRRRLPHEPPDDDDDSRRLLSSHDGQEQLLHTAFPGAPMRRLQRQHHLASRQLRRQHALD